MGLHSKAAEPSLIKVQPEASFAPSATASDGLAMSRSASRLDTVLTPQQLSEGLNALHAIPQSTVDLVMANLERIRALKKSGTLTPQTSLGMCPTVLALRAIHCSH